MLTQLPSSRAERWELLHGLVGEWFGSVKPEDGYAPEEMALARAKTHIAMPPSMIEWYCSIGRRARDWSNPNRFYSPGEIHAISSKPPLPRFITFYEECQGAYDLGFRADDSSSDPKIFVLRLRHRAFRKTWCIEADDENVSFSEFALREFLGTFFIPFRYPKAGIELTPDVANYFQKQMNHVKFPDSCLFKPHMITNEFYWGEGVVVKVYDKAAEVAAKNESSLLQFGDLMKVRVNLQND